MTMAVDLRTQKSNSQKVARSEAEGVALLHGEQSAVSRDSLVNKQLQLHRALILRDELVRALMLRYCCLEIPKHMILLLGTVMHTYL